MTLFEALLVGSGGFAGSVLRHLVSSIVQRWGTGAFPAGTLTVNLVGCLALGLLGGSSWVRTGHGHELRLLVGVGLLGGFTTYSTFSLETVALLRLGVPLQAAANVVLHVVLGVAAAWLGYAITSAR